MASALVVYESIFGDAHRIADAVADGLRGRYDVTVVAASEAPTEIDPDVQLLVAGGPTMPSRCRATPRGRGRSTSTAPSSRTRRAGCTSGSTTSACRPA